jgi:hypothetical protein
MEGEQEIYWNGEDNLGNDFEALLIDTIDDMDKVEAEDEYQYSDSFFTSVKSLLAASDVQLPDDQALDVRAPEVLTTMANSLVDELTSLSFIY